MSGQYREWAPPPHLDAYIEAFWTSTSKQAATSLIHPDGCMDIVTSQGEMTLVGAMPQTQTFCSPTPFHIEGIRFRPGMISSFLKLDAAEWTARRGPLRKINLDPLPLTPIQKAIAHLTARHGNVDLDWLAGQTNLSTRQFRRLSLQLTGLSPKYLARVLRFRHARELRASQPHESWTSIAHQAGYFDQAHLIRDFRALTGQAPRQMSVLSNSEPPAAR